MSASMSAYLVSMEATTVVLATFAMVMSVWVAMDEGGGGGQGDY